MKNKAVIGKCKIAKHPEDIERSAVPHREGARRMSPDKVERANKEVDLVRFNAPYPPGQVES